MNVLYETFLFSRVLFTKYTDNYHKKKSVTVTIKSVTINEKLITINNN